MYERGKAFSSNTNAVLIPGLLRVTDPRSHVATFTMVATLQSGAEAIPKRERGTLVFVKCEGSWKIG
jgi:hypothetical protein